MESLDVQDYKILFKVKIPNPSDESRLKNFEFVVKRGGRTFYNVKGRIKIIDHEVLLLDEKGETLLGYILERTAFPSELYKKLARYNDKLVRLGVYVEEPLEKTFDLFPHFTV